MAINRYSKPKAPISPQIQRTAQMRATAGPAVAQTQAKPPAAPPTPTRTVAANIAPQSLPRTPRESALANMRNNASSVAAGVKEQRDRQKADGTYVYGTDVAGTSERQGDERAAEVSRLQATRAEALQNARAKMNFAGAGLSGGGAALEGDIGRTQDRARIEALSALDRGNAQEIRSLKEDEYTQGRRGTEDRATDQRNAVELAGSEEDLRQDIDHDGHIGFGPDAPTVDEFNAQDRAARSVGGLAGDGSASAPFEVPNSSTFAQISGPLGLDEISPQNGNRRFVDEDGNIYSLRYSSDNRGSITPGRNKTYDPDTGAWV